MYSLNTFSFNPGSFEKCASKHMSTTWLIDTDTECFRGSFKVKRPMSGAKTRVQYMTLAHICYADIGTYCCVCIALLQVCIAVVHISNIQGASPKVNALPCWIYPLHQPQP